MTFKTITELEKGCGTEVRNYSTYKWYRKEYTTTICGKEYYNKIFYCDICKATLTQTKALLEMIEKKLKDVEYSIDNFKYYSNDIDDYEESPDEQLHNLFGMRQVLEELQTKLKGDST